jgi:hypothetical protein
MGVGEMVAGGLTMLGGALVAEIADRFVATHALTAKTGVNGSDGKPVFADTPDTSGSYKGLFNATAVLAPMNITRWLVGVGLTVVPFGISFALKKGGTARSVIQLGAFGAGVRTLLKGSSDLAGKMLGRTATGARLYDGEARAGAVQALAQGSPDTTGDYPSVGLGAAQPKGLGAAHKCGACAPCRTGVGACCGYIPPANPQPQTLPPTPGGIVPGPTPTQGPPNIIPVGTAPPPPPPPPPPATGGTGTLQKGGGGTNPGLYGVGAPPKKNPYRWADGLNEGQ